MSVAPLLRVDGLRKSFYGVEVLHGVSLEVRAGEALGLVGENGSGKSTSMNILGGVVRSDAGHMQMDGHAYAPTGPHDAAEAGLAFIHQELNLFPNLTVEENLFIDGFPRRFGLIDRAAIRRLTRNALEMVELDVAPSMPIARLAQGERQLIEIAKALSREARVIIFDEPTTSLTRPEVRRLFGLIERLKDRGIGIVYISHTLEDVMALCQRVVILRDGNHVDTREIEDVTRTEVIAMMVGREIDNVFPERSAPPRDEVLMRVRDLGQPGVLKDISFDLRAGEVLGLAGLMGSGRSELARILFGLDPHTEGSIKVNGRSLKKHGPDNAIAAGMAFLTEDRREEGLMMATTISDNLVLASLSDVAGKLGIIDRSEAGARANAVASDVKLSTDRIDATLVKHLSGGNQQKVVIGKWLMRAPRVFLLDEPTRGIDVGAKQEVYRLIDALVAEGCAVLLISSEIEELVGLSDRILTVKRGKLGRAFDRATFDREAIMAEATGSRKDVAA